MEFQLTKTEMGPQMSFRNVLCVRPERISKIYFLNGPRSRTWAFFSGKQAEGLKLKKITLRYDTKRNP